MNDVVHRTYAELEAELDHIRQSPKDIGSVDLIARRPALGEREVLDEAELTIAEGVLGDTWKDRPSRHTGDGTPHPDMQLNLMNSRMVAALAPDDEGRAQAGDQLYIDLDLSAENLPPGTQLAIGSAVIEVTAMPHTGCAKFRKRFGPDATKFINSAEGKALRLRGVNAKVVQPGVVRRGDAVRKAGAPSGAGSQSGP